MTFELQRKLDVRRHHSSHHDEGGGHFLNRRIITYFVLGPGA